jgi:hypothetical protein
LAAPGATPAEPDASPDGPGTGPTAVTIGGGAALDPPLGGVRPHAVVTSEIAIRRHRKECKDRSDLLTRS